MTDNQPTQPTQPKDPDAEPIEIPVPTREDFAPSLATPASRSTSTPDWHATTLASVFGHDGPA